MKKRYFSSLFVVKLYLFILTMSTEYISAKGINCNIAIDEGLLYLQKAIELLNVNHHKKQNKFIHLTYFTMKLKSRFILFLQKKSHRII